MFSNQIKHLVLFEILTFGCLFVNCHQDSNKEAALSSSPAATTLTKDATNKQQGVDNLEPRASDQGFVKDIVDRLHALDADIGKLLHNSTAMYAPDADQGFGDNTKGGERFTEVLNDLDSLQDEIGGLINNATKTRQYNILVRLRPLNNLLYRIRHNLHLMRNSLVAINAVSSLEKLGNNVLDSTLQAFMKPDAELNDEIGDTGNYDINLDKPEGSPSPNRVAVPSAAPTSTSTTTTTTTTTTTPPPPPPSPSTTTTTAAPSTSTTKRTTQRTNTRRNGNQRPNNTRRNNRTSTTPKPSSSAAPRDLEAAI